MQNFNKYEDLMLITPLNTHQIAQIDHYIYTLSKWQKSINLISSITIENIMQRHIADSLQLAPIIKDLLASKQQSYKNQENNNTSINNQQPDINIADFGSGGGLPSIILAIAMPEFNFYSIDSDNKKIAFQKVICNELDLKNITPIAEKIQNISIPNKNFDIIISRAMASLKILLDFSCDFNNNVINNLIFLKGQSWELEVAEAKDFFDFKLDPINSITNTQSKILKISNIKKKGQF